MAQELVESILTKTQGTVRCAIVIKFTRVLVKLLTKRCTGQPKATRFSVTLQIAPLFPAGELGRKAAVISTVAQDLKGWIHEHASTYSSRGKPSRCGL